MTNDQPADRYALIQAYNALIPDLVAQKHAAGVDVTFVDMSDLTQADITPAPTLTARRSTRRSAARTRLRIRGGMVRRWSAGFGQDGESTVPS